MITHLGIIHFVQKSTDDDKNVTADVSNMSDIGVHWRSGSFA